MGRKSKYLSTDEKKITNEIKIWNVAQYIRLSQEDADTQVESNSITTQKTLLSQFVDENDDLIIYDTYIDDGFSGTDFNRPGFQRLLQDMRLGKIDCVLTKDLSRLR